MYYLNTLRKRTKKPQKGIFESIHGRMFQLTIFTLAAYVGVFIANNSIEKTRWNCLNMASKGLENTVLVEIKKVREDLETADMNMLLEELDTDLITSVLPELFESHNTRIIKVGNGYCRMYGKKMPWKTNPVCVPELGHCRKLCDIANNCVGFSFAENPVDNLDSCKEKQFGRCILYLEEQAIGHQIYSSLAYDEESKAYDCYRHGESAGFYYFPLAVSVEPDPSTVENWALVLSTQGDLDRVAKTGEDTRTYGGLFDGSHKYHFDFSISWEEFMKSIKENDPVLTIELLDHGVPKTLYRGRVLTGHTFLLQLLTHAKADRRVEDGKFAFSSSDSSTVNRVHADEKYKPLAQISWYEL